MNGLWTVRFYADSRGGEPVREWLEELRISAPKEYGTVRHHIDLLERFGVHLGEPHSRQLEGRLRELRPGPWRVTYVADPERRLILLTSFRKRGKKTPPGEIARARRAMDDWLRRHPR